VTALGQKLVEIVRTKAAENPDFVYPRPRNDNGYFIPCAYVRDGQPSCLLGHALWGADLIGALFEHCGQNNSPFLTLVHELDLILGLDERKWLADVQKHQDSGRSWGVAVDWADNGEPKYVTT